MSRFEKLDDYFCPNCGCKDTLWLDNCRDDYYQGCPAICLKCNHSGYDIHLTSEDDFKFRDLLLDFIKEGK